MILAHVHIENYKQYAGEHDIPMPSAATIGVIGANGVGKTTLFEAIEWCLYSPSSIPNKDIRPRGRAGHTKVIVTLEMPATGAQYIVERELKRSSTQAVVYQVEPGGEETIVVQGTRQVTEHVAQKLIGLSHKAFTATFFTRQKELSFFGDLGDTDRRREVGKLLGLETIRQAQQLIADDRRRAGNEAQVLRQQYETQSKGRDFAAEIAAAEQTITTSTADLTAATTAAAQATGELTAADAALAAQQALKDQDTAIARRILELRGQLDSTERSRQHLGADLARLAAQERQRVDLAPIAARLEPLRAEMETLDALRAKAERKRALEQELRGIEQRRGEHIVSLRTTVTAIVPPAPVQGWAWDESADGGAPEAACGRLVAAIATVDVTHAERHADDLRALRTIADSHADEVRTFEKYRAKRDELDRNAASIVVNGEPSERLAEIDAQHKKLVAEEGEINARLRQLQTRHQQASTLVANLQGERFEDRCPTCGRPFEEHDAALVLEALQRQIREFDDECRRLNGRAKEVRADIDALERRRSVFEKAHTDLASLVGRINASVQHLNDQGEKVNKRERQLCEALKRLGREQPPTDADLSRATVDLQTWQRLVDARHGIEQISQSFTRMTTQVAPIQDELRTLADVTYDPEAHRRTSAAFQEATRAQTTVEQIDRELARRPQLETDLAACQAAIATISSDAADAERERAAIGFDPEKLTVAIAAVQAARAAEREAIDARHAAETSLRRAEHERDTLTKDQARISGLAIQADEQQREHDQLDQMYREFTEFERYAARWYAPRLSEITSELVSEVTDGKYDRVVFDDNFGIDIFDGEEEKFPLDTFSGGERDAIALCARIALSRVIGGQGATPPGFLVLDEVFGSLDRDRRTRLLEMLGAITNSGESFRQVFIISHVDDVRTAPIFDELWQVVEQSDGSSQLQPLPPGADVGEL
ncbi:MAG TPA: SMC family ATPase [Thermomicrobiales bacterium]|nr:SMC family ATPase [Thermomicrobiales bacterium]